MASGRRAGAVVIDITAGTAKFLADMDQANGKLREFGAHASRQANESKAAMALLGEEIGVKIPRHIRGFIAELPGVGAAFNAAFSALAVVGVINVLIEAGRKVHELYEQFKSIGDAPEHIREAFEGFIAPLHKTNDELDLANVKLENQIAKLRGSPQNLLRQALMEARVAADELAASLAKDVEQANKALDKVRPGWFARNVGESADTEKIDANFRGYLTYNQKIADEGQMALEGVRPQDKGLVVNAEKIRLEGALRDEIRKTNAELENRRHLEELRQAYLSGDRERIGRAGGKTGQTLGLAVPDSQAGAVADLEAQRRVLLERLHNVTSVYEKQDLTGQRDALSGIRKAPAERRNPLERIADQAQLDLERQIAKLREQATRAQAQAETELAKQELESYFIEQKLAQERDVHAAAIGKVIQKIDAETDALRYETEVVGKNAAAQRAARDAGIRARGRGAGSTDEEVNAQVRQAHAGDTLQDAQDALKKPPQTAREGWDAWVKDMRVSVKTVGQDVHDVLGSAFQGLGDQMTALITGQKTNWSSFFGSLASQFAQIGMSQLFKAFAGSGEDGESGLLGSLFSGFRAGGGDVDPGRTYVVGERGPELLVSRSQARIIPNQGIAGGQGTMYYIDARGTDAAVVEQRVQRSLMAVHGSAVRSSALVQQEMMKRKPKGSM